MNRYILPLIVLSTLTVLSVSHSVAKDHDSQEHSHKQKSEKHDKKHHKKHDNDSNNYQTYFSNDRQVIINNYYYTSRDAKHCPPGLAKKHNRCEPPGSVKQWRKGQALPADVVYYDVPSALTVQLGRTPEGQKIVRVGTDLLLISVGTGMVIDAIQDLNDVL
ncbi:hypothetical protein ABHN84_03000 [Shewanella vesiculosa]|uniref:RcnB family protein n=1 Tax=Shewanella vesiculosa TaxID=518738 RepID=A0ABV0FKA2_9GAMM|nr:hypothetical protein [Shewanella sp. SG41-3]MBB1474928.1 hypothetical protein [Shewanella sp. SG41-3]|tara:strand:- start:2092 stop:2577 length:486 start_codon:yes stop_codon:yes gene_type:complete